MFYENDRIVRKQRRFIRGKAEGTLSNFRLQGLNLDETMAALELLLEDKEGSETHKEVVNMAIAILKQSKDSDEKSKNS